MIDLLGIDHTGRLVVIELKATADLQLPFQALDYWLRVRKHLAGRRFRTAWLLCRTCRQPGAAPHPAGRAGARIPLDHRNADWARCLLEIEVTRIGLAADWRSELRVMFRLRGSERP